MFTVPAAIRRVSGPPPVSAPIFTGPVVIPAQTVDTAFSWDMSQYFSGDPVVSYALTNDGGQAWLSINTSTGELSGTTPATPVTVSGVIVTATNTGGSTPTDAFGFEVEAGAGYGDDFVFTITATAGQDFTLPYRSGQTYNCLVKWGDGSEDTITVYNQAEATHTFVDAGDYQIRVSGVQQQMYFNNGGDRLMMKSIDNFGAVGWNRFENAYLGCSNMLTVTAGTVNYGTATVWNTCFSGCNSMTSCDLSGDSVSMTGDAVGLNNTFYNCNSLVTVDISCFSNSLPYTITSLFRLCTNLTTVIGTFPDTSNATAFSSFMRDCPNIDYDISGFDLSSCTNMDFMMSGSGFSQVNYDPTLVNYSNQTVNTGINFHAGSAKYSESAARLVLTDTYLWNINDGGPV